jgi:copper(I)-binding protein
MKNQVTKNFSMLLAALFILISSNSFAASIKVSEPYAREVPLGHPNSAAFMVLKNTSNQDRALVNAYSDVSNAVELHTHIKEGGMMRMRRVDKIDIKAGSETVLKPGGLHIMFIGLKQQLKVGDKVELKLEFDDKNTITLQVPVKMVAGMQKKHMHQ